MMQRLQGEDPQRVRPGQHPAAEHDGADALRRPRQGLRGGRDGLQGQDRGRGLRLLDQLHPQGDV